MFFFALEGNVYRKIAGRQNTTEACKGRKIKITLIRVTISANRTKENIIMQLRNFEKQDASILADKMYGNLSVEQIEDMIRRWNTKQYDGKYFDMFAVVTSDVIVGMLSLYKIKEKTLHIGPVIFPEFRKKGFAKAAMTLAFDVAKKMGFCTISQQIRTDNVASVALHRSLGFEIVGTPFVNAKGNEVCIYEKHFSNDESE